MPQPFSHTKTPHQTPDRSAWTLPILGSVLGHAIILVAIGAPIISPPQTDTGIQTTLASQEQFAAASQALKAHHDAQMQQQSPSEVLAADQALMNKSQHTYTQPRVRHSSSQIGSLDSMFETPSFDQIEPTQTIGEPTHIDSVFTQAQNAAAGDEKAGRQPSQAEINSALASVRNRIEGIWKRYPNQPNQTISFQVNLDDQGNVTGISFGGGHPDLRESVSASVYAAAPFTELAGIRNSVKMRFHTEQLISTTTSDPEPISSGEFNQ